MKKILAKIAAGAFGAGFGIAVALGLAVAAAPTVYQTGVIMLTALTGLEHVSVDNGGPMSTVTTTGGLAALISAPTIVTANTSTSAATLTAANMIGNYGNAVLPMTGTLSAGAVLTLPTLATLVTGMPGGAVTVGQTLIVSIANESSGAFAWTLATNTGWTVYATAAQLIIPQNTYSTFIVQFTSQTTATITYVGSGFYTA